MHGAVMCYAMQRICTSYAMITSCRYDHKLDSACTCSVQELTRNAIRRARKARDKARLRTLLECSTSAHSSTRGKA